MRSNELLDCIKSSIKLKQQEEFIEKTLDNFVNCMKLEPDVLRVLQNERNSYTTDRIKLSNSLRASVMEIRNDLRAIKSVISDLQEDRKIDVESFKVKLITLANKIREFKKNCSLENLTCEEIELDQYLRDFSLTLKKYESRNNSVSTAIGSKESLKKKCNNCADSQDYRDIRDFDALVVKTGHTQNWSEEDHLFFLKVRRTSHNVPAMVAAIRKKCPDLTVESIVNHEAWYKVYLDLREKQRKSIKEWRRKKEFEKRYNVENTKDVRDERNTSDIREQELGHETNTKESDLAEDISRSNVQFARSRDSSTNRKKEILTQWRMDRENTRALEIEKMKSESKSQRIWKENRRLTRAKQLKAVISAYREKSTENLTSSSTTSVTDLDRMTTRSKGTKLIKCFRRQDEEFVERRKALLASKKSTSSVFVRQKIYAKSDEHSTLLKPTKVWLEKCKQEENHLGLPQQVLYVKDIPKLATCNWRNRESS